MSAESGFQDPYQTPALPQGPYAPSPGARPGWLTALCVIAIVLGVLGFMNGVMGVVGTVFAEQFQTMFTPAGGGGMPPEMQAIQDKFQDETLAVQQKFYAFTLLASILRIAVATALVVGGIQCLGLKESGRQILLLACGAAVLFEIGQAVLQSLVSMEMMTAVNSYFENFLQSMPRQGNGPPPEVFMSIMKGSLIAGFVVQYAIGLLKVAFYIWGALFLSRQAIKALFGHSAPPAAAAYS
jgi:hypothetical protein